MVEGNNDRDKSVLISQAASGDGHALEVLLLMYHDQLVASLAEDVPADLCGTVGVEDLLQETYIRAFRGIGHLNSHDPGAFFCWLRAIATNQLRDTLKRHRAAKRGGGRLAVELSEQSMDRLLVHVQSRHGTPSRIVARREAIAALQVALSAIDDSYRQAIDLRYVRGWSVAKTAETMQRTEQAVHMLCYRGLRKLEAAMGRASQFFSTHA